MQPQVAPFQPKVFARKNFWLKAYSNSTPWGLCSLILINFLYFIQSGNAIVNVLSTYQRLGKLTLSQCSELLERVTLQIEAAIEKIDLSLTLTLATQYRVSGYDAQYLAFAKTLNVPLIRAERKLRLAAPDLTLSMQAFLKQETDL